MIFSVDEGDAGGGGTEPEPATDDDPLGDDEPEGESDPDGGQDPEPQKYKLGEDEYTAEQIKEWQEAHQNKSKWQAELTQKSQRMADYKRLGDWLGNQSVSAEEKWKWFEQNFPKQAAQTEQQDDDEYFDPDKHIPSMKKEIEQLKQTMNNQKLQQQRSRVQDDLSSLKDTYKDKWNEKHEEIVKNLWIAKGGDLKKIAKDYFGEFDSLLESQKKNWIKQKADDVDNPSYTPKGGSAPAAPSKKLDEKERKQAAGQFLFGNEK